MALLRQALIVTGLISKSIYIQQSYCIEIPKRKKLKKKTNELDCLWVVFLRVYQYRTYLKANSWTWICDEIVYRSPKGMPFLKCTMWIRKTVLQNKSSHLKKKKIHSFMEEDFINFYRNRSLLSFKKEKKKLRCSQKPEKCECAPWFSGFLPTKCVRVCLSLVLTQHPEHMCSTWRRRSLTKTPHLHFTLPRSLFL